jgi:FkbH-like protein
LSLPSDFFKAQHLVGKRIIRRNETTDINGANVFNGRIFVLRNEAWEPHLSHAASIADIFSINLEFEYSIYDDSPLSYPVNRNIPVLIWLNWERVLNKKKYIQDLAEIYEGRNPLYLVLPRGPKKFVNEFKNFVSSRINKLNPIQIASDDDLSEQFISGYSHNELLEISTYIGQNLAVQLFYPEIKAIISDLDNTLYKGILGEDNLHGLVLTSEYKLLQDKILELFNHGILINLVSKNNASEVDMLMSSAQIISIPKEKFTYIIASWNKKSESVSSILQKLNFDQESTAFIDDNPRELFEIGLIHPRILAINASNPNEVIRILDCDIFSKSKFSTIKSDQRSKDIQANEIRYKKLSSKKTSQNILRLMGTKIMSKPAELVFERERAEELFRKTNQFNFSNQRSKMEMTFNKEVAGCIISCLSDIYSDSGIISAFKYVVEPNSDIVVQEFVISCRALGREVEKLILKSILKCCAEEEILKADSKVFFVFNKSERNIPAQEFIEKGFAINSMNNLMEMDKNYWATIDKRMGGLTN